MRITAISTWFPTDQAPSRGSFVLRDLHAIARHHQVRLIHLVPPQDDDGTRQASVEGIDVLRVPMSPKSPVDILRAARSLPTALEGSDVVHTMAFPTLLPFSVPGIDVTGGAPWVHTEHWSALSTPASLPAAVRPGVPALARLLRGPDRVTSVCEFLAEPIRAVRASRPVDLVPCIVEPGSLVPRRERTDGTLRLVSTGGLIPRKDPLVAVRTVSELVARGINAHLTWLGEGPLRQEAQELIESLELTDRVSMPGTVDSDGVRHALGEADLFFGPTRADNFFVSAAEAIVAGRPVVLGSTGGQGEYVTDEVGELVQDQDPALYADAIERVDERTRDLSAERIAATIGDSFSSGTVGRLYAEVYDRATGAAT